MPNTPRFWGVIPPLPAKALGQVAKSAEDMGLEGLWGIQLYGPPFAPLAAAAMVTDSIKLGTGVLLLPLRNPTLVAKMIGTLDWLSNGRAILGVGVGGEFQKESTMKPCLRQGLGLHFFPPFVSPFC